MYPKILVVIIIIILIFGCTYPIIMDLAVADTVALRIFSQSGSSIEVLGFSGAFANSSWFGFKLIGV